LGHHIPLLLPVSSDDGRRDELRADVALTQDLYYINQPGDKGFISPESIYSEGEIEKAIDSLSDEFRIPFRMHIEGYKYKEIADELGLKIGTVKSRIFFTRQKLMLTLKDYVK
jgi:RNA polymerase sigma-70 factor (ECF subfamily)